MKKTLIFAMVFFMLIGAVAASEDITNDTDVLSVDETQEAVEITQDDTLEKNMDDEIKANETSTPAPTVSAGEVKGEPGKEITLKATVTGVSEGTKVTFKLNGATYTGSTDANGVASVKVKCPKSEVQDPKIKFKGKSLTRTDIYSKTYQASASLDDGTSATFKVTSAKKTVTKYKVKSKKIKTVTLKIKKGTKGYKKGNYAVITDKSSASGLNLIVIGVVGKYEDFSVKFKVKTHYKEKGKWKWDKKWTKVPANNYFTGEYGKKIKVDKVKIQYTQYTFKKIR